MELRLLRYFVAVAEELNFTHAAERLHTAQPSLSQQIRQLEDYVGTPLLDRDRRRVKLTEAGRVFLREARRLLADADHAVSLARQAARAEAGVITIAIVPGPEGQLFSRVMPLLLHNYPDLDTVLRSYPDLDIVLRSMSSPEQIAALQKGEINLGLLRGPVEDEAIGFDVISREDVVAVVPADHPLAGQMRIAPRSLAELPLIQLSRSVAPAVHDTMIRIGQAEGVQFRTLLVTENIMTTLNAVAGGIGFTLLAAYVEDILPKNVVVRPLEMERVPQLELLAAYRKDDPLPALAFFLGILRDREAGILPQALRAQ